MTRRPSNITATDGSGTDFFEVTSQPAIQYSLASDEAVIQRVNHTFTNAFNCSHPQVGHPLAKTLTEIVPDTDESDLTVIDQVHRATEGTCTQSCETVHGEQEFQIRVVPTPAGGYLEFNEPEPRLDGNIDTVDYLAHTLRNPLEAARVHTDIVRETGETEHLETVQRTLDRMETIIADAVQLSRQGSGMEEAAPIDVGTVASDAWQTVETQNGELQVQAPGRVTADRSRLQDLFENLFRNAVEHAGHGVTVTVDAFADGFYVADDGPGIPASERDDVFEVGTTNNEDGTGLGLAIVATITESHGWSVTVTESDQGGARFEFTDVEQPNDE